MKYTHLVVFFLIAMGNFISLNAWEERPDSEEYNIRTQKLFGKIQRQTRAVDIEPLKYLDEDEVDKFCITHNYNREDIDDVLKR